MRLSLLLLFIGLMLSTSHVRSQVITGTADRSSISKTEEGRWKIVLTPKEPWFDTGLRVTPGAMVRVGATGRITIDPKTPRNTAALIGPKGVNPPCSRRGTPMPDAACGALIMQVGNSKYLVGEGGFIQIDDSGPIMFGVNDDALTDNTGSFSIDLETVKPIDTQQGRGFSFELIQAKMMNGQLAVMMFASSVGTDRKFKMNFCNGSWEDAYFIDTTGTKYVANRFVVAGRDVGGPWGDDTLLVAGIRTETKILFDLVSPNANRIAFLEFYVYIPDQEGCLKIQFRNVPITR